MKKSTAYRYYNAAMKKCIRNPNFEITEFKMNSSFNIIFFLAKLFSDRNFVNILHFRKVSISNFSQVINFLIYNENSADDSFG